MRIHAGTCRSQWRGNAVMNPGSVLEVENVTVRFGGLTALDAVSLAVPPRHVMGVIGPNGAGKTTLLNVLCGFTRPDDGQVLFGGRQHTVRPHRLPAPRGGAGPPGGRLFGGAFRAGERHGRRDLPGLGRILVRVAHAAPGRP